MRAYISTFGAFMIKHPLLAMSIITMCSFGGCKVLEMLLNTR